MLPYQWLLLCPRCHLESREHELWLPHFHLCLCLLALAVVVLLRCVLSLVVVLWWCVLVLTEVWAAQCW